MCVNRSLVLTINGNIDDVGASSRGRQHRRNRNSGCVMGMDVDRNIRVLLSDGSYEAARICHSIHMAYIITEGPPTFSLPVV